jgi:hypothetical protein
MVRLLVASALVAAGGGCVGDNVPEYRPLELNYLTQAVFEPSCGAAQCHSSFKQSATYVFDTPEGARSSLVNNLVFLGPDTETYDPYNARKAGLIRWITETDPDGRGIGRMPFDAPLPNRDVELLIEWIEHKAPGAQCDPSIDSAKSCTFDDSGRVVSVSCTADWNFDFSTAIPCTDGCALGQCL